MLLEFNVEYSHENAEKQTVRLPTPDCSRTGQMRRELRAGHLVIQKQAKCVKLMMRPGDGFSHYVSYGQIQRLGGANASVFVDANRLHRDLGLWGLVLFVG